MKILRNYKRKEYMKCIFILKFFTFILLIWICYLKCDKGIFGISYGNEYKVERTSFACFNRLLAKHEIQKELRSGTQREFLSNNVMNKNVKNVLEYTSTVEQLNKRKKNNLDSYKKAYNRRYYKKNILGKLECYCEKKVFHKFDDIIKLSENMKNDKKSLKKVILKKHCKGIIILTSILLIELINHIIFTGDCAIVSWCTNTDHSESSPCAGKATIHASQDVFNAIGIPNLLLVSIISITLISVVIYTLIKLVKYERLKMGRGKMNTKDYIKFCKEIFN
ncbi:Plasmodium exported protein, unknown function [Plasmodium vivax]|uniref:Variable surface protein n=1 Tax=Plasmodium vivax TaxID=5855 RepID=A0A565A6K9_PLAVI|nr:Plasmodium exported protein, unknown function [Plasmodium vivax]